MRVSSLVIRRSFASKKVIRHALEWRKEGFYDEASVEEEMRRVLDICHGCRRCFNLCDSFPILFDAVDNSKSGELDTMPSSAIKDVSDACTLCDLCFTSKCPYVPPHEFALDFPHLILRYRAMEQRAENEKAAAPLEKGAVTQHHKDVPPAVVEEGVSRTLVKKPSSMMHRVYANQDVMGPLATRLAPLVNAATGKRQSAMRKLLERTLNLDEKAPLPSFTSQPFLERFESEKMPTPAPTRKVVLYATCFVNHNRPSIGEAAVRLLRASGVHVEVCYPQCCGMPQLEQGLVGEVAQKATAISEQLLAYVDDGFEVVSLTPSCTLMIKQEWPLLHEGNAQMERLSEHTHEVSEYLMALAKEGTLCQGEPPAPMKAHVTLHHACHTRAQNIGWKSRDLMKLIPDVKVSLVERCSGHGGTWGFEKPNYETALRVGKPVMKTAAQDAAKSSRAQVDHYVTSDCPMAADHVLDGMVQQQQEQGVDAAETGHSSRMHPIEILAKAYSL